MTNITDTHVPSQGRTETRLVGEHDRGSQDRARRVGAREQAPEAPEES